MSGRLLDSSTPQLQWYHVVAINLSTCMCSHHLSICLLLTCTALGQPTSCTHLPPTPPADWSEALSPHNPTQTENALAGHSSSSSSSMKGRYEEKKQHLFHGEQQSHIETVLRSNPKAPLVLPCQPGCCQTRVLAGLLTGPCPG